MNLSSIDLNLLVVLDALLTTRSTTRAAKKVALSQPATSHALGRLRELFSDPLLVRDGRALVPTPFAEALAPRVTAAIRAIEEVVEVPAPFDARTTTRLFVIGGGDYATAVLMPPLAKHLAEVAPQSELFVKSVSVVGPADFADGSVELALAPPLTNPRGLASEPLFDEEFVCAVRHDHPSVGRRLTLERFVELGHVLITPRGDDREGIVDTVLRSRGLSRRVAVAIPHFLVAPEVVARTDYVLTLPRRLARHLSPRLGLRVVAPPIEIPGFTIAMIWHPRSEEDAGHRFLRDSLRKAARRQTTPPTRPSASST